MTWAIVDRVFKTKIGDGGAAKAVLLSLANHCDEHGGSCFPGQDAIQIETGLSLDTIQRQLAILETGGWLKRKKRPGVKGQWPSWTYQINLEKLAEGLAPPSRTLRPGHRAAPCGLDKNDQAAPCGFTGPHGAVSPGRTMRLEPILEPINEPSRARDTEPGGPRQRAEALVPPPMGELDADLRRLLAEKFKYLVFAKLVSRTTDTVTLSVPTPGQREVVLKHCQAEILAAAGATELKFKIELPADVPPLRRLP